MKKLWIALVALSAVIAMATIVGCGGSKEDVAQAAAVRVDTVKVVVHDTVTVYETAYMIPSLFKATGKDTTLYLFGATGYLAMNDVGEWDANRLNVWPTEELTGVTPLTGDVTAQTKVKLVNSTITASNPDEILRAFRGRLATVTGKMRCTGRGEGSKNELLSIDILLHQGEPRTGLAYMNSGR